MGTEPPAGLPVLLSSNEIGGIIHLYIHFKVSAEGTPVLTTQLYMSGDPYLNRDKWVRKSLTISPETARGGKAAQFDFVLRAS
jgi:protocatechuate 3,4-dioxygenase beta subunit